MLHYYLNVYDGNMDRAFAIMKTARDSFEPFEKYLKNVIEALEKKEVKARWQKVKTENIAMLSIIGGLYEIPKKSCLRILENEKGRYRIVSTNDDPDFSEKLIYKVDNKKEKITVSKEDFQNKIIQLPIEVEKFDKVSWGGDDIELQPDWYNFQIGELLKDGKNKQYKIISVKSNDIEIEGILSAEEQLFYCDQEISYAIQSNSQPSIVKGSQKIQEDNSRIIIYSEKKLADFKEIKKNDSFITDTVICFENGSELRAERENGLTLLLSNSNDYDKIVIANNIKFRIEPIQNKDKEAWRIQLVEIDDNNKNDDIQALSPLRYFFDDEIEVTDDKNEKYQIVDGRESENTIILKKKQEKGHWEYCLPEENTILKVKVNTYPFKKQQEAVSTLKKMPVGDQSRLIQLFEDRDKTSWNIPSSQDVHEWYVITDTERSGSSEQRDFVNKALNTPDFAILEGPPGSGKTTVVLELICQLAKQNKRILLCGSTHVAIDNILERLKEKRNSSPVLLEQFNLLPVRIGDEKRINEDIREFQINNLKENAGISEELLLEAANLVCGTTIGILQHPKFRKRNNADYTDEKRKKLKNSWIEPIIPEFDYLIIDESSKTTFQEFLVPALYAKKWILVGDVMQLSPFTERGNVVSNLEYLTIKGEPLSAGLQSAVFYLYKLKDITRTNNNRFVLPVSMEIIKEILSELLSGRIEDFKHKILLFITEKNLQNEDQNILIRNIKKINFLEMAAADIIFVDENNLSEIMPYLSERCAILRSEKWERSEHAFIHNVYQMGHIFSYKDKGREFKNSFEIVEHINVYFKEKNWAEEAAWRIDREHQLRLIEKSKSKERYTKQIEELLPKSIDKETMEDAISGIAVMSFPSILESLAYGIKSSRKLKTKTTVSEGFKEEDLDKRRTLLAYQHRMHPEISCFPRERFYKSRNALLDLERPDSIADLREWDYAYYTNRSIWVPVDGETKRNYNEKEVDALMKHLNKFVEWAKNNQPPKGKEWTAACLTFYRGQESRIREKLQMFCNKESGVSTFVYKGAYPVNIKLHTVDKFQGHEADVVFLSMVQTNRVGFMDNPNRLNVAITRAKFQLVLFGKREYFLKQTDSDDLSALARELPLHK